MSGEPTSGTSRHGRTVILGIGLIMLVGGLAPSLFAPHVPLVPLVVIGALVVSVLFEGRYRRAGSDAAPQGPDWAETAETFRDEESGGWVRVWQNRVTGERRYLPDSRSTNP